MRVIPYSPCGLSCCMCCCWWSVVQDLRVVKHLHGLIGLLAGLGDIFEHRSPSAGTSSWAGPVQIRQSSSHVFVVYSPDLRTSELPCRMLQIRLRSNSSCSKTPFGPPRLSRCCKRAIKVKFFGPGTLRALVHLPSASALISPRSNVALSSVLKASSMQPAGTGSTWPPCGFIQAPYVLDQP